MPLQPMVLLMRIAINTLKQPLKLSTCLSRTVPERYILHTAGILSDLEFTINILKN